MLTVTSPLLSAVPGLRHAFFTRQGGVSQGLYASLNVGVGSGDDPDHVRENRARAAAHLGGGPDALATCYQIHSPTAVIAQAPLADRPEGDAVVTGAPGVVCGVLTADCGPILLVDPQARVAAAAHAGWKGALTGIIENTVTAMRSLGADPARIVAAVGPCIGPASYEVGLEFRETFMARDTSHDRFFQPGRTVGKSQFDLPSFILYRLEQAGIGAAEWVGRDTVAEPDLFYSNRRGVLRGEPDYGRLLSAIALT